QRSEAECGANVNVAERQRPQVTRLSLQQVCLIAALPSLPNASVTVAARRSEAECDTNVNVAEQLQLCRCSSLVVAGDDGLTKMVCGVGCGDGGGF
ncbi:Hypothetical predicted protein, partial [Olea europaea subsp. europaea]